MSGGHAHVPKCAHSFDSEKYVGDLKNICASIGARSIFAQFHGIGALEYSRITVCAAMRA